MMYYKPTPLVRADVRKIAHGYMLKLRVHSLCTHVFLQLLQSVPSAGEEMEVDKPQQ